MAKHISELMKKINLAVVEAARVQADQKILELRLVQLRQTAEVSQKDLAAALASKGQAEIQTRPVIFAALDHASIP